MPIHKLHYRYENDEMKTYIGMVYACNWACNITPRKYSYYWKDVTCKNCLKQKKVRNTKQRGKENKRS